MKKTSKIFGAVALSAALAMGTVVPAFAAADDPKEAAVVGADGAFKSDKTAETTVSVFYNPEQVSATIPLNVTIVATGDSATKAETIIAPNYDKYAITNTSATATIKVAKVNSEELTGWKLAELQATGNTMPSGATNGALDIDLKAVAATTDGSDPTYSDPIALENSESDGALSANGAAPTGAMWQAAPNGKINLELSGKSILSSTSTTLTDPAKNKDLGEAFKIKFTISK